MYLSTLKEIRCNLIIWIIYSSNIFNIIKTRISQIRPDQVNSIIRVCKNYIIIPL
jgi:hypothetical protein